MELVVGILAAWGLLMLVWTLMGALLLPLGRRKDIRLTVLIRGKDQAPLLEQYLKGVLWLRNMGMIWWDILILDDHLDQEAVERAAELAEKEQYVSVVSTQTLTDWVED